MSENKIRIGITQGDVNGIGLEVIIKTLLDPQIFDICTPVLFSSQKTASYHRKALNYEDFSFNPIRDMSAANPKKANIFNCYEEEVNIELGKPSAVAGKYALKSIEAACDALQKGRIDAIVTAPINKHTIQSENFPFAGHTEYFEKYFGQPGDALMLMVAGNSDFLNGGLKVAVVTGHIPLANVSASISTEKIVRKIRALNKTLLEDFSIRKPKIAVLGLNPHAGDNGTIGKEDMEMVIPAINKAVEEKIVAYGPYPADGFFGSGNYKNFDAVLAMYHDQGLVPFKALSFTAGINFTAGLPVIRTSPDHGTAYDLAGKNQASEESFRNALYLACDIYKNRKLHKSISANPLQVTNIKRER